MVKTKRYFVEITSLDAIDDDRVMLALSKNIPNSHINIYVGNRYGKQI